MRMDNFLADLEAVSRAQDAARHAQRVRRQIRLELQQVTFAQRLSAYLGAQVCLTSQGRRYLGALVDLTDAFVILDQHPDGMPLVDVSDVVRPGLILVALHTVDVVALPGLAHSGSQPGDRLVAITPAPCLGSDIDASTSTFGTQVASMSEATSTSAAADIIMPPGRHTGSCETNSAITSGEQSAAGCACSWAEALSVFEQQRLPVTLRTVADDVHTGVVRAVGADHIVLFEAGGHMCIPYARIGILQGCGRSA